MKVPLRLVRAIATLVLIGCRDIHAPDQSSGYRLEITPPNRAIALKEQLTLQVAVYSYSGYPLPVPPLTWSSSDASVASVDANGVVTGLALGYAAIKAVGGGMTGYLSVQIRPAGLRITMTRPRCSPSAIRALFLWRVSTSTARSFPESTVDPGGSPKRATLRSSRAGPALRRRNWESSHESPEAFSCGPMAPVSMAVC